MNRRKFVKRTASTALAGVVAGSYPAMAGNLLSPDLFYQDCDEMAPLLQAYIKEFTQGMYQKSSGETGIP